MTEIHVEDTREHPLTGARAAFLSAEIVGPANHCIVCVSCKLPLVRCKIVGQPLVAVAQGTARLLQFVETVRDVVRQAEVDVLLVGINVRAFRQVPGGAPLEAP